MWTSCQQQATVLQNGAGPAALRAPHNFVGPYYNIAAAAAIKTEEFGGGTGIR